MQKKVIWSGLIALLLIIIIVVFSLLTGNKNYQPVQACDPYADLNSAITSNEIKSCDCLKNVSEREQCRVNISNAAFYSKALREINSELCANITTQVMKETCVSNTKAKAAFANPYKEMNLKATSTNKIK